MPIYNIKPTDDICSRAEKFLSSIEQQPTLGQSVALKRFLAAMCNRARDLEAELEEYRSIAEQKGATVAISQLNEMRNKVRDLENDLRETNKLSTVDSLELEDCSL